MNWRCKLGIVIYCVALFFLASITPPRELDPGIPGLDKVAHALMYGLLAALISLGMLRSARAWLPVQRFWLPPAVAFAYGAMLETYQALLPYRSFDIWDIGANGAGALLAQLCLFLLGFFGETTDPGSR